MLILLSPTKQMDFSRVDKYAEVQRTPDFVSEAIDLNRALNLFNRKELMDLMKISEKIAVSTHGDIKRFNRGDGEYGSALYVYSGTVFQWIKPEALVNDELMYAAKHLRILSGMYGILKPMDRVFRYRLEMKTPLSYKQCRNLYQYWKQKMTDSLVQEDQPILNLASGEYIKALDKKKLKHPFITIHFKERTGNAIRTVGMYSKMTRGLMAGRIIREQISDPFVLKKWDLDGYNFDPELSSDSDWIFVKKRDR